MRWQILSVIVPSTGDRKSGPTRQGGATSNTVYSHLPKIPPQKTAYAPTTTPALLTQFQTRVFAVGNFERRARTSGHADVLAAVADTVGHTL